MVGYRAECDGAQAKNASFNKRVLARNHVPAERREQEQRTEEAEIRGNTPVSCLARFRIYRSDRTLLCSRVGDGPSRAARILQCAFSNGPARIITGTHWHGLAVLFTYSVVFHRRGCYDGWHCPAGEIAVSLVNITP